MPKLSHSNFASLEVYQDQIYGVPIFLIELDTWLGLPRAARAPGRGAVLVTEIASTR